MGSYIVSTAVEFPKHYYPQEELLEVLLELWGEQLYNKDRLRQLFSRVEVGGRHLAVPKERYPEFADFGARNRAWLEVSLELLERLVPALTDAVRVDEVDYLVSTTVTGLAVPTLEARLMNRCDFSPATRRVPLFGLGCLAGAAGLARLNDLLAEDQAGLLLASELCSLTLQSRDFSVANMIATGLFGDGSAGVALCGPAHPALERAGKKGPLARVIDTRSDFYPDSEGVMGWEFESSGFQIVLNGEVPTYAEGRVSESIRGFLAEHNLKVEDVDHWIAHPGGPKVMAGLEQGLGIPGALDRSRRSLKEVGNLSSVSVLCLLDEVLRSGLPKAGDWGLMMAMGPAFCAEAVLLRWESRL